MIKGGIHIDSCGRLTFVNDFRLPDINRFYTITQSPVNGARAWQGHREEAKYFYCLNGAFIVKLVEIDNWENPSPDLKPITYTLTSETSEILAIPGGFANGMIALEEGSQLMVFSERTVEQAKGDEYRFEKSVIKERGLNRRYE